MNKQKWFNVIVAAGVVLALIGAGVAVVESQTDYQVMSASGYLFRLEDGTGTEKFSVTDAGNATVAGTFTSTGNATMAGTLTSNGAGDFDTTLNVDGTATMGEWLNIGAQTAISVTAGAVITPTGTYQPLTSAAAVTCDTTTCIFTGTTAGDLLLLENQNASDTITIDGTGGTVECKADVVLGAGDTLLLFWDGADWQCISNYDNS